jgi:hypothetical protein
MFYRIILSMVVLFSATYEYAAPRRHRRKRHPFPTYPQKKKQQTPVFKKPFICPVDVPLGYDAYAAIIDDEDNIINMNYWDRLSHIQIDRLESYAKKGVIGVRSSEKKLIYFVFGMDDVNRAQSLQLQTYAEEIVEKRKK